MILYINSQFRMYFLHYYCIGEALNQFRNIARQYSYFFRLFQVLGAPVYDQSAGFIWSP